MPYGMTPPKVVKTKFNRWLFAATDFDGYWPIADLARDAKVDPDWPAVRKLDEMLVYLKTINSNIEGRVRSSMVYAWTQGTYELTGMKLDPKKLDFMCSMVESTKAELDEDPNDQDATHELRMVMETKRQLLAGETDLPYFNINFPDWP